MVSLTEDNPYAVAVQQCSGTWCIGPPLASPFAIHFSMPSTFSYHIAQNLATRTLSPAWGPWDDWPDFGITTAFADGWNSMAASFLSKSSVQNGQSNFSTFCQVGCACGFGPSVQITNWWMLLGSPGNSPECRSPRTLFFHAPRWKLPH